MTLAEFRDYVEMQPVIRISGQRHNPSSHMNKLKNLKKKIRRLEGRLQKGTTKLAKLKRKLGAATTAAAAKTKKNQRRALKTDVEPAAAVKGPSVAKKAKRKVNLTPERREQLAAAMRARWAAKRAAAATITQSTSSSPGFSPGDASQPH